MKIGILTSGGDCPGLNATMRAFVKAVYAKMSDVKIIGILNGYTGLINGDYREMAKRDFSAILTRGGTILGSIRQPFRLMTVVEGNEKSKLDKMLDNYKKLGLDLLVTLGGSGTHKTAALLASKGCNVLGLPKTIDNDIWGTDKTFGFSTALEVATDCIDRLHSTAASHGRAMIAEVMGNKTGWLALESGIASASHAVLIPELPFNPDSVVSLVARRKQRGKTHTMIVVAEGAITKEEAPLRRKEREERRAALGMSNLTEWLAQKIETEVGIEARTQVIGYLQRGGEPNPYDRMLCSMMGSFAAELAAAGKFGVTVALSGTGLTTNPLAEIAGKLKVVPADSALIPLARNIGIRFCDEDPAP